MIGIAARATNGVKIPNCKATWQAIIELFKQNLTNLRNRVKVCARHSLSIKKLLPTDLVIKSDKTGLVSLTCDAWQASNQDAYFAVTGHWNEEMAPGVWEAHSALFGFTQMNSAHDDVRLGQALFNIVKRLGIVHKVHSFINLSHCYSLFFYYDRLDGSPVIMHPTTLQCSSHSKLGSTHLHFVAG